MEDFGSLLFIFSLGAFAMPIFSKFLRLPNIVAEILYGIALRLIFSDLQADSDLVNFLSTMGFLFIMFMAGFELNFEGFSLSHIRKPLLSLVIIYPLTYLLWQAGGSPGGGPVFLLISALSVGLVFIGLKMTQKEKTAEGQAIIWAASIGELFSILGLIVMEVQHQSGQSNEWLILEKLAGILALTLGAYFIIRVILLFFWLFPKTVYTLDSNEEASEMAVRLAFLVMLSMIAVTEIFHIDSILGAFLGGMVLSFVFRDKHLLEKKLSSIGYGFFIPFFFIKVGWDFRIAASEFMTIMEQGLLLYGLILIPRLFGSFALIPKTAGWGQWIRESTGTAFLIAAPLTLLVAIGKVGLDTGLLQKEYYQAAIVCSLIGGLLGPTLYRLMNGRLLSQASANSTLERAP